MDLELIFDDVMAVPASLRRLIGVDRFGGLVFQRRTRLEAMRAAVKAAGAGLVHLVTEADRAALSERLRDAESDKLFLHCPSHVAPSRDNDLPIFLRQIRHAPMGLRLPVEGRREQTGWALMHAPMLQKLITRQQAGEAERFFEEAGDTLADVFDRIRLIDLTDERALLEFLSGAFDARHFNLIENGEYTVTKRSKDRIKLRREFDFYHLMPPSMQMFLVQPFDFSDDGETASYRMERLAIPDMAQQWVLGSFGEEEFDRFLRHVFHLIGARPQRPASGADLAAVRDALYVGKVKSRIAELKAAAGYAALEPLLERVCGGIDALVDRYLDVYNRMRSRFPITPLAAGHGDLCFSNIIYSKTNQYLKLIDPRGADNESDLYTDPYYDIAKLSHSILGGYDYMVSGKFEIVVDESLVPRLALDTVSQVWRRCLFTDQVEAAGYDINLVRLFEASLFISMLPLHIDKPRRVLAFAMTATEILDELVKTKAPR
jgi:hypothetical protein